MADFAASQLLRSFFKRSFLLTLVFAVLLAVALPFLRYTYNVSSYESDSLETINRFILKEFTFDVKSILENPHERVSLLERINIFMEYSNLVEFRIWDKDFRVVYSYIDKDVIGKNFPDNEDLRVVFASRKAKSSIEEAVKLEHAGFKKYGLLVEMYVPVIVEGQLVGAVEVYRQAPHIAFFERTNLHIAACALIVPLLIHIFFYGQLKSAASALIRSQAQLEKAYDALSEASFDAIRSLTKALELRDKETEGHSERVVALSVCIARRLGLSEQEMMHLVIGAYLHDVGKIGVPDAILLKPGKLTPEERAIMETHVPKGQEIVRDVAFLRLGEDVVRGHHEKWDGTGYAAGLKGEQTPITARVFALVDVLDALMSDRPYKKAFSYEKSCAIIREGRGGHFDPKVVDAFFSITEDEIQTLLAEVNAQGVHHLVRQAIATFFGAASFTPGMLAKG